MFGRRRRDDDDQDLDERHLDDQAVDDEDEGAEDLDDVPGDGEDEPSVALGRQDGEGPWDSQDPARPTRIPDGWGEIDLGALLLTVPVAAEVRMDVDEQSQTVTAVSIQVGDSALQVMPYAGPRSSGIWDEVRGQIASNVTAGGGTVENAAGPMGAELRAVVPADQGQRMPARFMGVDGPRWFLRAVLTGPAAKDDVAARPLLDVLRAVVVVRDDQARPLQEPLPVRLPTDGDEVAMPLEQEKRRLTLTKRGPEITEIH